MNPFRAESRPWSGHFPGVPHGSPEHHTLETNHHEGAMIRIALLDHIGGGNLGDETTQTAVIQGIKKRWPDSEICSVSQPVFQP